MPTKRYIEGDNYTEEIVDWEGLTEKEEEMANFILGSLYNKEYLYVIYEDGKKDVLVRMTGDFWLNNNDRPFESEEELEEWIEHNIRKANKIESYCKYTDEKRESIKK